MSAEAEADGISWELASSPRDCERDLQHFEGSHQARGLCRNTRETQVHTHSATMVGHKSLKGAFWPLQGQAPQRRPFPLGFRAAGQVQLKPEG